MTGAKIKIGTKRISPVQLRALAEEGKYMNTPVRTYFRKISNDEEARIIRTVRAGLAQGLTPTQLAAQISGGVVNGIAYKPIVDLSRAQATALANTMTRSSANKAAARLYMQNQSLIRGVQQVSTLDAKTSDVCRAYDGAQWEYDIEASGGYAGINTNLPFNDGPPRHFNCRSYIVPILKTLEQLKIPQSAKGKVRAAQNALERTRASVDAGGWESAPGTQPARAAVPQSMNFETWLRGKPDEYQRKMLGEVKYEAWKNKSFSLRDFLDRAGRPKSIAEIRAEMNMGGNVVVEGSTTAAAATSASASGNTFYDPLTQRTYDLTGMPDVPLPRAPLTGKDEWGWPEVPKPIGIKEGTPIKFPATPTDRAVLDIDNAWQTKMKKLNGMSFSSDETAAMRDARYNMLRMKSPEQVKGVTAQYTDFSGTLHIGNDQLPKLGVSEKFVSTIDPVQFEFDDYRRFRGVYRPNKFTIGISDAHYRDTGRQYISPTITHEYGHHWHISWVDQGFRHPTQALTNPAHMNKSVTTLGSLRKNETLMGAYEKAIYEFQKAQRNFIESIPGRAAKQQIKKQFAYNYTDANRYLNVRVWKPDDRITWINLPDKIPSKSGGKVPAYWAGSRSLAAREARDSYRKAKLKKKDWYGDKWDALEAEADAQTRIGVSQYAHQNVWEWFAESWEMYHHGSVQERMLMKRYSPDTYKFIEDFLLTIQ